MTQRVFIYVTIFKCLAGFIKCKWRSRHIGSEFLVLDGISQLKTAPRGNRNIKTVSWKTLGLKFYILCSYKCWTDRDKRIDSIYPIMCDYMWITGHEIKKSCSSLSTRRLEHGCRYFLPSSHKRPGEVRHCCCWVMRFGSLSALRLIPKVLDRVEVRSSVPAKLWTPLLYGPDLTNLLEPHHHCINACNFMHFYPAVPFNLK